MPGVESSPNTLTKTEARSVQSDILHDYESLTPRELAIRQELGEVASDGAGIIPPIDIVDGGFGEQPALPPGRGEPLALPPGAERPALPSAERLALPPGQNRDVRPITVGHIDLTHNAERKAYDLANRKIEEMKKENEARFLLHPKRIMRNIWGYNYAHRKALTEARDAIKQAGDVNAGDEEFSEDMRKRYGEAIFDQFFNGPDEAIDKAAGENREFFADDHEATKATRDLYSKFAQAGTDEHPAMTDDEFNAAIKEIRAKHMGEQLSETATGELEQDNYLEAARAMRGRIEQGEAVEDVLEGFRLMRGESRADARTESHKTKTDQLLDKYEKSRFGSLVPSTVLAAGFSVGMFAASRGFTAVGQLAFIGGGAAAIGVVAGAREHMDITKQRAQMGREKFYGKNYNDDKTERNEKLSEYEHERLSVDDTLERLAGHKEKLRSGEITSETLRAALDEIATIQALKNLSASKKIDLFDHGISDDPNKHISDRTALAVSQAELKVLLNDLLKSGDAETLKAFGLAETKPEGQEAENIIGGLINGRVQSLQDERLKAVDEKDAAFQAYRRRESIKKGAKVAAFSLVAGTVMQEVYASISSEKVGLVEQVWGGNDSPGSSETMLAGFLPDHEAKIEHINTQLSQQRVDELRADVESKGGYLEEKHTTTYTQMTERITPAEYAKSHPGELRHFENVRLFDNNTSQIDMNELGGQLSRGADGSVQPWDTMTRGGSMDGNSSIDMTNRSNNVFTIALKQPDGTHLQKVFEYGQSVDRPWADMLYQNQDGTWGFKGDGYIAWGQSAGDTLNVAASIAGDGGPNTLVIENSIPEIEYDYVLHTPASDLPTDLPGAVWMPGSSRVGVAQRPVTTPSAAAPAAPETQRTKADKSEPSQKVKQVNESSPSNDKSAEVKTESEQQVIAREAGWPFLDLDLGKDQGLTSEQWKAATELVALSNDLHPNVTNSLERLRLAIEFAEREGASNELKAFLSGIYNLNQSGKESQQDQAQGPRPDARSYNKNASDEPERAPPSEEEIAKRTLEVSKLLDDVAANIPANILTKEQIDAARVIYLDIVKEYGDISTKSLTKRAAAAVHPDIRGGTDKDLIQAVSIINERLRPKQSGGG